MNEAELRQLIESNARSIQSNAAYIQRNSEAFERLTQAVDALTQDIALSTIKIDRLADIVQGNFARIGQAEPGTVNNEAAWLNAEERLRIIEQRLEELMNASEV